MKRIKEIIINLTELLYDKKHLLTLNFPFKCKLKLNYIISNNDKDLSSFIKEAKEKKVKKKYSNSNIFGFFNEKLENKNFFGELDSEEGEEDNESVQSSESESENIESDDEDTSLSLKSIKTPQIRRSKSQYYKKKNLINLNKNNIKNNINNNIKKENNINIIKNEIDNKENAIDIKENNKLEENTESKYNEINRLKTVYIKRPNNDIVNINNFEKNKIKPKEIALKETNIDLTKPENQNINTFCNGFLLVSFPYNNAKIIENSKIYRSICGHLICSKLPAMESVIIYKYPIKDSPNLELNNFCASICFPTGIKVCYNQDRRTTYKSFCTNIVNDKGEKYYMTVFHFYHKMDTLTYNKKYTDTSLKNYLRKFGDNIYHTQEEKEKLEKDLEECQELGFREFVYIPYALALISKYPYIDQMKEVLNNIFKIITNYEGILNNNNLIEKSFLNDLISYLIDGIPIPIPNSCILFNLPFTSKKINIESPYKNNLTNISNLNYGNILKFFSIENILIIYRLMLFEQKLLFIDKDYNRLCSIMQSFIDLLYPIEWVNTLIPVMSEQMTRYLQTFLPFINGISEDLLNNNASNALKEAEEGVFQIFIIKGLIKLSKENDDIFTGVPRLPEQIYKKLYNELKSLKDLYDKLDKNKVELYSENINHVFKNIFLESSSIMLYDFMDFIFNIENNYTIFNFDLIIHRKKEKDAEFYKELSETQIFQNFIQNMINNKNNFALFINTIKNVREKYIIDIDKKKGVKWKNSMERKVQLKDIQTKTSLFSLPNHLIKTSLDNTIKYIFKIEKDSWTKINNNYINKNENEYISESNRISNNINIIDEKLYKSQNEIVRFIIPEEIYNNQKESKDYINDLEKPKAIYIKNANNLNKHNLRNELYLNEEEKEEMKENFKKIILSLLKNESNISIDQYLTFVYTTAGRNILSKLIYKKGFKVVKKIKEECFISLTKLCLNALISICNINENEETLDFAVKITQSAFCFCKENDGNLYLIDELRSKLGKDYFMWIKQSFWNTWQNIENYFGINDYRSYCDVLKFDFIFKFLRLKIDKEFIFKYLKYSLEEKMNLLLENEASNDDLVKKYSDLYNNTKNDFITIIDSENY